MISDPEFIPSVSVIIPSLEEEKEIVNILSQFTPELKRKFSLEVIVSDGGSKDQTLAIARRYADLTIHPAREAGQTIAEGRNLGAEAARGEIFMFLNADVRLKNPDLFFSTALAAFSSEGIVAATCNVLVNPQEETTGDAIFHTCFNFYCRLLNAIGVGMGRGECHIVRRGVFREVGGYNNSIPAGEDFELFLRLRRRGSIAFLSSLTVFESPRRYRAFGYTRISLLWFLNSISVMLFKRSLSKSWIPVR